MSIWSRIRRFPWPLIALLCTAFGVLRFLYLALDRVARDNPVPWVGVFVEELTGGYSLLLLIPPTAWIVLRYPIRDGGWKRHLPKYAAAAVAGGFAGTTFMYFSRLAIFGALGFGTYDYGILPVRYLMELPQQVIVFTALVVVIAYADHRSAIAANEMHMATLEKQLAQAQVESLRLQIQPHFLFNALNALSAIVYEDPQAADRMISRLSEFLRRVLETNNAPEAPLRDELELLDLYLDVMRARFEDRLQCVVEADRDVQDARVPQLSLQPVVENAIRHGADPITGEIRIRVQAYRRENQLLVEVTDCGRQRTNGEPNGLGLGLKNIAGRLDRLYGAEGRLTIEHEPQGTRVSMSVPMERS